MQSTTALGQNSVTIKRRGFYNNGYSYPKLLSEALNSLSTFISKTPVALQASITE